MARASWKAERESRLIFLYLECFPGETGTRFASQASAGRSFAGSGSSHNPMILKPGWRSRLRLPHSRSMVRPWPLTCSVSAYPCFHPGPCHLQDCAYGVCLSIHPSAQMAAFLTRPTRHHPLRQHSLHLAAPCFWTVPPSPRLSSAHSSQPGQVHSPSQPQGPPLPRHMSKGSPAAPAGTGRPLHRSKDRRRSICALGKVSKVRRQSQERKFYKWNQVNCCQEANHSPTSSHTHTPRLPHLPQASQAGAVTYPLGGLLPGPAPVLQLWTVLMNSQAGTTDQDTPSSTAPVLNFSEHLRSASSILRYTERPRYDTCPRTTQSSEEGREPAG